MGVRAEHRSDGKLGRPASCVGCGQAWPCDATVALAEVDRLSTLVARLVAIPHEHRDEFMGDEEPINWLNVAAPGMPKRIRIDAVRDTCDALGHKLRAAAESFPARPCPTCGSHSRLVRRIPVPTDADYRNGSFYDPDYDPKFSNPCTDPWHEEAP